MITSTITQKGQTTLPKQIREKFGLNVGKKLVYEIKDDTFIVRPHPGVMASFGILKGKGNSTATNMDVEDARQQARSEWAEHATNEG